MKKSVLISGGVVNTGLAIAKRFLKEGWTVFITGRPGDNAGEVAAKLSQEYSGECYGLDFTPLYAKNEAKTLIDTIGKIGYCPEVFVGNAANLGLDQNALSCDVEDWEEVLLTNVMGYFVPARELARALIKEGKSKVGSIVFLGSVNAQTTIPNRSAYTASKGAILSMTKGLALDFAPYGIRVNCVMPGPIWSSRYDANPEMAEKKSAALPLGRVATTDEIASCVYFFATEASGNATGSSLVVDGGLTSIVNGAY